MEIPCTVPGTEAATAPSSSMERDTFVSPGGGNESRVASFSRVGKYAKLLPLPVPRRVDGSVFMPLFLRHDACLGIKKAVPFDVARMVSSNRRNT